MTLAKVLGPDGEVWATAPDETWLLRGDSWPDPYVIVELCWAGRKQQGTDGQYEYGRGRLKHRSPDGMSSWQNDAGHDLVFNPDFWRALPQGDREMKKIITVKVRKEVETEVEVEFPIYSRHDIDGDDWSHTIFMRRDEDGTVYSIKQAGAELEVEIRKASLAGSPLDYIMGTGEYESSPAEFHEALSRARKFLARIPEPQGTISSGREQVVNDDIEAVVIRADQPRQDGTIVPADEVQKMADGVRLFWDEGTKSLVYRGPLSDLPYRPAPSTQSDQG